MFSLARIFRACAVLAGLAAATHAPAALAATCGVNGSASATPVVYDPFNPDGISKSRITLTLNRVNTSGGGDTRLVNFYLRANATTGSRADGSSIVPISSSAGATTTGFGQNIFYNYTTSAPALLTPSSNLPPDKGRFFHLDFSGNNPGSDSATIEFEVTLPGNLDLNAVRSLAFDVFFACNIRGGNDNNLQQTGTFANAITFPITVLSALRTYYAGTALDFGEIGDIATGTLGATPKRTSPGNYVFVQSSGAYSVTLASQNGFRLFKPGAAVEGDKISYQLRFLGENVNPTTNPTPGTVAINKSCQRAGLTTVGNTLPIQATLVEGGSGKNPSPVYADVLTITVTPLIYSDTGANQCGGFGL